MKNLLLCLLFILPLGSLAIVDTRSAGYSKTFTDFKTKDLNYPLEIKRTYNSRSLYNGLFGFGWCSNLETRLTVLPDGMIKVVECGGGMEVLYQPKGKTPDVKAYVNIILKKLKVKKVKMSEKAFKKLKSDLLKSQNLRANFLSALEITGQAEKGLKYYAQGRVKEYVVFTSRGYTRYLPNGLKENFDKKGRLIQFSNKNGKIEISWSPKQVQIMNDRGHRLILALDSQTGKAEKATYNKKTVAKYKHKGQDLVKVVNSEGTFLHSYDKLHNLRKNTYPDKTTEELTYNLKKDWVIGFKDRRNCNEKYDYGVNHKNPDHYFSTVEKICRRRIVNKSKYEFWHKTNKGGGKYLHRARARINGRIKTDVTYHPVFGTPVSFFKNGVRTKRNYYGNGFLKEKDNPYQNVKYSKYNQKCRKPELVTVAYKNPNPNSKKKIIRKESIHFHFDKKCQLFLAKKSEDEWIKIGHNSKGQMNLMEDQSRKKIRLKWHPTFNKPELIIREGVGALRIVYNSKGEVGQLKGLKQGPTVVAQVTSVFNSFLSALAPVAEEMVIL
ncbi:MAG: DUF6531 domain-containing protein [Oligoflexia bacterium]|nr:DUF6531 domain-containing protein [Oligoflexia bacterium]